MKDIEDLWTILRLRLGKPGYQLKYGNEVEFEAEVWKRMVDLAIELGLDPRKSCLTSHATHADRSAIAWREFCREDFGPDVNVLGSNNRLDIVLRHPEFGSIGIEVKCLGAKSHAAKLTQGLGQAVLNLHHRDRTLLVIHCGKVDADKRKQLRKVAHSVCNGTKTGIVVVP